MSPLSRFRAVAGLMLLGLAASAVAKTPPGPVSSASVRISISVAPRYGVSTGLSAEGLERPAAAGPDRLCLETNGHRSRLPVMLMLTPSGDAGFGARAAGRELAWCGRRGPGSRASEKTGDGSFSGLLLVHPE